jgi:hypothetical protein
MALVIRISPTRNIANHFVTTGVFQLRKNGHQCMPMKIELACRVR